MAKVERLREQGSRWWIAELPVLVLGGETSALLVTEINTAKPLARFLRSRKHIVTLEQAGDHFRPPRQDSVIRLVSDADVVPPAVFPFDRFSSESRGGEYQLAWRKTTGLLDLDPMLRIASRVTRSIQRRAAR